jgi:hypothetical protein
VRRAAESRPSFRLSKFDIIIMISGAGLSILLHGMDSPLGLAVPQWWTERQ